MKRINIDQAKPVQLLSKKTNEKYSKSLDLVDMVGLKDIVAHHETLTPNQRASAPHYHSKQEELLFVLGGNPTLIYGKEVSQLRPGDTVGIKPNSKVLYFIQNDTSSNVSLLVICSKPKNYEVIYS